MQKRKIKKEDFAQNALRIVEISTGQPLVPKAKNEAAVALGRLGGIKGGKARWEGVTPEAHREIAQRAAKQRWAKAKGKAVDS